MGQTVVDVQGVSVGIITGSGSKDSVTPRAMARRCVSLCSVALLALLILDVGVLPTAATRPRADAMSTGKAHIGFS